MPFAVEVKATGPVFQNASGPLRRALNDAIRELVDDGTERLNEVLRPRPAGVFLSVVQAGRAASTGHYRRSIHAVVRNGFGIITDSKVVYGPWLEGLSRRNAVTRFKGYASFRRTAQWLQRKRVKLVVNKHISRLVRKLGGR